MSSKLKSLAGDTIIYGMFTVLGRFLTFLLTPLYTNLIPAEPLGDIMQIFTYFAFMNVVYSFGLESAFFRFFEKDNIERTRQVFSSAFISIFSIAAFTSILIFFNADYLARFISDLPVGADMVRLGAFIPLLDAIVLIPYALLRMTRQAKRFSITKFFLIIITVALNIVLVVFMKMGAVGVLTAQLISSCVGVIIFFPEIKIYLSTKLDFQLIKEMILFGLPTMPANLSAMILQVSDRPIIKALTGSSTQVALYGVSYRMAIPMLMMVTIFDYAWKPFYLSHANDQDAKDLFSKVLTYFSIICAALFLGTSLYIDFVVRMPFIGGKFINPQYWSAFNLLPIIMIGLYFNGVFSHFAAGFLITKNTKYIPIAVGSGAVISLSLNFILIPIYGITGSAWALFAGYFSGAAILFCFQRKIYPMHYDWKRLVILWLTGVAVYLVSSRLTSPDHLLHAFLIRTLFIVAYVVLLYNFGFFTKEEINKVKTLLKLKK